MGPLGCEEFISILYPVSSILCLSFILYPVSVSCILLFSILYLYLVSSILSTVWLYSCILYPVSSILSTVCLYGAPGMNPLP